MPWLPDSTTLMWLQIATGFMGALTLVWLGRQAARKMGWFLHLQACFSPGGECRQVLLDLLKKARREVLVQAPALTAEPLILALIEAKKRGVEVDILLDRRMESAKLDDLRILVDQGLDPLIDAEFPAAEDRAVLIDRKVLALGSYEMTDQGESEHAGNLLVVRGAGDLAARFRTRFFERKGASRQPEIPGERSQRQAA